MPLSGRRGKTRARRAPATEAHEPSDAETPEAIQTPSRSTRKRGRPSETTTAPASRNTRRKTKDTRGGDREDTEGTEAHDRSDAETEPAIPTEQEIISHLKVADRQVNATEDFANDLLEGQEHVPGYGKIAGRDWAFIIRKVEVNIGRPEAHEKLIVDGNGAHGPSAQTVVDIDLGPDRQVSRSHAIISYDPEHMNWFIVVNGRNGLRVDNNLLKRGTKSYLRNGCVIEIANTQMAFITTAVEDNDGPVWDGSIIKQAQKSSEEDDEGDEDHPTTSQRAHATLGTRSQMSGPTAYSADFGAHQHRTHPHSQRAAMPGPPGTPMRSQQSLMKSSPAANYARGVMMESTESIDYSADTAKDLKPPHSYAQLIGMAILSTLEQQMTLNNIYKWIMANYAFYRFNTGGWQNSIRHNLSLNKAFTKIARRTDEPGKGMKWMIEPTEFDTFVQQGMKGCRRPNPIPGTQSTLGSPTSSMHAMRTGTNGAKKDDDVSPPLNTYQPLYPSAMEAYTPERGPRQPVHGPNDGPGSGSVGLGIDGDGTEFDLPPRSTPRNGMTAAANAAGSPPALYVNDDGRTGPLDTPFPLRPSHRLAPPSTLKRPSDFIQFSSPAPFWKMEGLVGSTPFKPYDLSPLKTPFSGFKKSDEVVKQGLEGDGKGEAKAKSDEEDGEGKDEGSPIIHSSSPPRLNSSELAHDASPTMSRPATAVAKTLTQLATSNTEQATPQPKSESPSPADPPVVQPQTKQRSVPVPVPANAAANPSRPRSPPARAPSANGFRSDRSAANEYTPAISSLQNPTYNPSATNAYPVDDGEDEGIDLAKGFQPIGAFHQRNHLAMSMGAVPAPAFGR